MPHSRQTVAFFQFQIFPKILLVVRQLNHQRALKRLLQPLRHHERHQMPQMQRLRRRPPPRVQIKFLALFVATDDHVQFTVWKKQSSTQPVAPKINKHRTVVQREREKSMVSTSTTLPASPCLRYKSSNTLTRTDTPYQWWGFTPVAFSIRSNNAWSMASEPKSRINLS